MNKKLLLCAAVGGIPLLLGAATAAHAQDTAKDAKAWTIPEVVVTAQKREQRLQEVPASVSAITGVTLAINRIQGVGDLDSVTPNLSISSVPAGNTSPTYSLRGVLGLGTAPGADKGVALYIDGVYIGSASGSAFDLADIERVEVLKGPQGTLFGRNSTGGAISINTRGPRGEFHVKQDVTFGNYDQFKSRTRIDSPQLGPFSAVLTYAHSERRGEIRNKGAGTVWDGSKVGLGRLVSPEWLGDNKSNSWAAVVKFDATSDINFIYRFDDSKGTFTEQGVGITKITSGILAGINAANGSPSVAVTERPDSVNNWATVPSRVAASGHSLTANWRVNENLNLKNVVAYRKSLYYAPLNQLDGIGGMLFAQPGGPPVPGMPVLGLVTSSAGHDSQWTEEFQADYDSKFLHVTTGYLWFHQDNEKGQAGTGLNQYAFAGLKNYTIFGIPGVPLGLQPFPTSPDLTGFVLPAPAIPQKQSTVTVVSKAVYAQGEFHVRENLDFVLGARYTVDKKRGIDTTIDPVHPGDLNYDGNRPTYTVGLNYKPTSAILAYLKYSTGYISGGKLATLVYQPETAKSWEVGLKADWLDRRLRTNLAVFSAEYGSLQAANSGILFGVPKASQVLVNSGDAKAKGFELEVTAVPVQSLTVGVNLGYLDFNYENLKAQFVASGSTLPTQRPKWTNNAFIQYVTPPVFGDARFSFNINANYRSAHNDSANALYVALAKVPASTLINSRIALERIKLGGATGSLAIWGRNLTDEKGQRYIFGVSSITFSPTYERARTVGVDLTVEF
jgi:iron complex outermembrane receptor protein